MSETLRALAEAPQWDTTPADDGNTARKIADCDRRLVQYRAALDAGASPATVAAWIAETEAEKASCALVMRGSEPGPRMTEREIKSIVDKFADIAAVLTDADPDDKAEIFRQLGLRLTYHPGRQLVQAQVEGWRENSGRSARRLGHPPACRTGAGPVQPASREGMNVRTATAVTAASTTTASHQAGGATEPGPERPSESAAPAGAPSARVTAETRRASAAVAHALS
jgi:hypothetical protein